jgi:hypothetical protein
LREVILFYLTLYVVGYGWWRWLCTVAGYDIRATR